MAGFLPQEGRARTELNEHGLQARPHHHGMDPLHPGSAGALFFGRRSDVLSDGQGPDRESSAPDGALLRALLLPSREHPPFRAAAGFLPMVV